MPEKPWSMIPHPAMILILLLAACGGEGSGGATSGQSTADVWRPSPGATFQWQLSGLPVDTTVEAQVYDLDLFDTSADLVNQLHSMRRKVICYMSAGSYEDWRPDKDSFPPEIIGADYDDWPGEKWLDIRRIDLVGPIMEARLDLCREKGFDAVEPDNIDGYSAITGFPLTFQDQLAFNIWLAKAAHDRGLSIGLKNDSQQVSDLLGHYDWALTEDCFAQGWCADMTPFIEAGKAVFATEYTDTGVQMIQFCAQAGQLGLSAILKYRDLDAWRQTCP
ncbi:MAG: endo alpha-1,4 polygalactosaminidase [Nitrospinota bacterium]|nr:endo alpha-1,4 polygalactosaminidase [Nitrospinota bacterium]